MIHAEMEPGDVLLHDVMVAHGSERAQGNALRRTIYYEFRSAEQILSEGPWDREWIEKRMRLLPVALDAYRKAFPNEPQYEWRADEPFRPAPSETRRDRAQGSPPGTHPRHVLQRGRRG